MKTDQEFFFMPKRLSSREARPEIKDTFLKANWGPTDFGCFGIAAEMQLTNQLVD